MILWIKGFKNYYILGIVLLIFTLLIIPNFSLFSKIKTQISSPELSTQEYNWYFNPREDGKQPTAIEEASFFKI